MDNIENTKWHLSEYVIFTENPNNKNEVYCFNLLKKRFLILLKEEFDLLFKINNFNNSIIIPKKFFENELIVNYDEYSLYEALSRKNYINNSLNITICPTLNCNFNVLKNIDLLKCLLKLKKPLSFL